MSRGTAKIKSKAYCIIWLITHGFIPQKYFWYRKIKIGKTSHLFFSYDKYQLCGKDVFYEHYGSETYTVGLTVGSVVWDYPKGLLKAITEGEAQ